MNLSKAEAFEYIKNEIRNSGRDVFELNKIPKFVSLKKLYYDIRNMYNIDDTNYVINSIRDSIMSNNDLPFNNISGQNKESLMDLFRMFKELVDYLVQLTYVQISPFEEQRLIEIKRLGLISDLTKIIAKYDYYFHGFSDKPLYIPQEPKEDNHINVFPLSINHFISTINYEQPIIWNVITKQYTVLPFNGRIFPITTSNQIIFASFSKILIWNFKTMKLEFTLLGHTDEITNIIKLSNKYMASGSKDGNIKIWNLQTGKYVSTLSGTSEIDNLIFLKDNYIVSKSSLGVQMWHFKEGKLVFQIKELNCIIKKLDEYRIVCLSEDGIMKIINLFLNEGQVENEINMVNEDDNDGTFEFDIGDDVIDSMIISGNKIIVALNIAIIKVYNWKTHKIDNIFKNDRFNITKMIILPNGQLFCGYYDHSLRIWDLDTGNLIQILDNGPFLSSDITILPLSNKFLVSTFQNSIRIWE